MYSTGIVRKIDELGRIVIPKEIRKQLMMKEGEGVSFSLEGERIILTKFSMVNKAGTAIQILLDELHDKYQNTFLVTDNRQVIASSEDGLSEYQRKPLTKDIARVLEDQELAIEVSSKFLDDDSSKMTILPLVVNEESKGALIMLTNHLSYNMIDETLLYFVKEVIEREIKACG